MATRGVHFVGSIGLSDSGAVFDALASRIGDLAPRYPDGETGERTNWIRWQQPVFDAHPDLELLSATDPFGDGIQRPVYRLRPGVDPATLDLGNLGYADVATESYRIFAGRKAAGVIPSGTRFQVSLPTPVAVINSFVDADQRAMLDPVYERAMLREVARLVAAVPANDLAVQWDVCQEVVGHDGGIRLYYGDILQGSLDRLARLGGAVPEGVQLGFHLCYGDPGHKHLIEPEDTATAVAFANGICATLSRPVDFIHLPVPRGRTDDAYFAPLGDLRLPAATRLILGLVHHTDGVAGTLRRIAAAEKVVADFDVATECGFGRRPMETISALLDIHAAAAGDH